MFYRLRKTLNQRWFDYRTSGVFATPPVSCDPGSRIKIVSQLYHPDLTMYLLAAKSFARYLRPREFVIVDDGLLEQDRDTLARHLGQVRFVRTKDVDTGNCPRGGCWERLVTLGRENADHYVIQLDSDTLTVADPSVVRDCAASERTFTMGTTSGQRTVPAREAAAYAQRIPASEHVQYVAERVLDRFPDADNLKYVRGCAGFTGFAPGHLQMERIEYFSGCFERLMGRESWSRWGSEQVTSNILAANAPGGCVLPVGAYPFWAPGISIRDAHLIHFFGTFRFQGGEYASQSRSLIRQLNDLKHSNA